MSGGQKVAAHQQSNLIPAVNSTVKGHHGFADSGPSWIAVIYGNIIFQLYRDILHGNLRQFICQMKLGIGCRMLQDNDPKHRCKSTLPSRVAQSES